MLHSFYEIGKNVCLISLKEEDIQLIRTWRNRDDVRVKFINQDFITEEAQKKWYENYISKPGDYVFIIIEKHTQKKIGMCAFYNFMEDEECAEFGRFIIGDYDFHGKGYGKDALETALRIAFKTLDLKKVNLEVFKDNIPAVSIYKKCGFKHKSERKTLTGVLIEMEITKDEFSLRVP